MAVFNHRFLSDLHYQVRNIGERFFNIHPLIITDDEFVTAFIKPEHVSVLKQTEEICGQIGNSMSCTFKVHNRSGDSMRLNLSFYDNAPIIMPNYAQKGWRDDAPPEFKERMQEWIDQRWYYGCMFGDAMDIIQYLNDECGDDRAFAAMFPILPTLILNINSDVNSMSNKKAKKLAAAKGVGRLPVLPPDIKSRIHDVSVFLTACTMLDHKQEVKRKAGEAIVSRSSYDTITRPHLFKSMGVTSSGSFL